MAKAPPQVEPTDARNALCFPSPVYVALWIDDLHVVVGVGGNRKFGMTNRLTLLRVNAARTATAESAAARKRKPHTPHPEPIWDLLSTLDVGSSVLWCASQLVVRGEQRYCCISHIDSFSIIQFDGPPPSPLAKAVKSESKNTPASSNKSRPDPQMQRVGKVGLITGKDEPDKKPIVVVANHIFVAQDNNTIAVFNFSVLLSKAKAANAQRTKTSSPTADEAPCDEQHSVDLIGDSANDNDAVAVINVGTSRTNDIAAHVLPWDSDVVLLGACCGDKQFRLFTFNVRSFAQTALRSFDGAGLGVAGALFPSSLRMSTICQLQDGQIKQSPGKALEKKLCAAVFIAIEGKTAVVPVTICEKEKRIEASVQPKCEIIGDVITTVSQRTPGQILAGTANGTVLSIARRGTDFTIDQVRLKFHIEALSAVASSVGRDLAHPFTFVATTDIAQQVKLSVLETTNRKANPPPADLMLFKRSASPLLYFAWLSIVVLLGALLFQLFLMAQQ